jgi:branched-chain amino acid aminotransferase
MRVEERKLTVKEVIAAAEKGTLTEAFGVGTAATIAPIESLGFEGRDYVLPALTRTAFSRRVFDELDGIKHGTRPDSFGWVLKV